MPENLFTTELPPGRHDAENIAIAMLICHLVLTPTVRLILSTVLFSAWMTLLLFGWTFGGLAFLLIFAAVPLFPWKSLKS